MNQNVCKCVVDVSVESRDRSEEYLYTFVSIVTTIDAIKFKNHRQNQSSTKITLILNRI